MKSLFIIGFFLSCQILMAQTYTLTNKTATTRSVVSFNVNLKTGLAATTTATTSYSGISFDIASAPVRAIDTEQYTYSNYVEPASATPTFYEAPTTFTRSINLYE